MQHVAAHGSVVLFAAGSSPGWRALPCCSALMQLLLSRGQHAIAGQQQQLQQQQLQQQQNTMLLAQQRQSTCESISPQPWPTQALAACALPQRAQRSTISQLTTWQQPLLYSQAMGLRTQAGRGAGSNHRRQQQQRQQEHRAQQHRPQQQEPLPHQAPEPSAAELTALIMEADSPRELLQSVVANHQHINHIHIVAALNRATALWPTTATPSHPLAAPNTPRLSHIQPHQQQQQQQSSGDSSSSSKVQLVERQQLEVLMQQLSQPLVRALPRYSAREITSALWSYAQCGLRPPPEVLHECVNNVCSWDKLREAEPKHVVNLSWATSKLGCRDKQLFSYIAAVALSGQMQRYSPAQLSILSQAFTHAAYQDADLGRTLMDRTLQVLQEQLHLQQQQEQKQQQQQQQGVISRAQRRKAKHKGASNWGFTPASLAGLIWSSAASGWLVQAPQVMQLSAAAALYDSFLDDIRPRAAANYVWAFASTLAGGSRTAGSAFDQQHVLEHVSTPTETTSSSSSSSTGDVGVAASTAAAAAASGPVAAGGVGDTAVDPGGVLDPGMVWEAALGVTAAALRRVDEADANNLARLLWSTATLADWVIRNVSEPSAAAAAAASTAHTAAAAVVRQAGPLQAAAEGRVVFNQLCSALGSYWQQHPSSFTHSVVVTAWGLIAADKAGLWRAFTPPPAAAAQQTADQLYAQQQQQQQQQPSPPTLLLQQLLRTTVSVLGTAKAGRQHAELPAAAVADLSVAFAELKPRLEGYAVLWEHCSGPQQQQQQQQQQEGGAGDMAQGSSTGGVEASSQQQGKEEEGSPLQLLSALSAAGDALAAAAWQHAGSPGALEVRDVSRMLTSFCTLQVDDNGLYHDLVQHWSQEALMGCSTKYLAGALYAAVVFARAKPELVQSGGLPAHTWQHLLSACGKRWGSFSAEEQRRVRGSVAKLMRTGLGDAVADELLQELAETVSVARNVNN